MFVIKRDGKKEEVHFDKITARIKKLCYGLDKRYIDPVSGAPLNPNRRRCLRPPMSPHLHCTAPRGWLVDAEDRRNTLLRGACRWSTGSRNRRPFFVA